MVDRYGNIHYNKSELLYGLRNYVSVMHNSHILKEERLEDVPLVSGLRHACAYTPIHISMLPVNYFNLPEVNMSIPYFFCPACGKVYFARDFI